MKNKKGFTLVELLVVIAIIGLLVVIAVPAGMNISNSVKKKALDSKIELIESAAIVWGQENKQLLNNSCTIDATTNPECIKKTISELLDENALEEDAIESGSKVLKNPVTDGSINDCYVYVYIKNKRVYAKYTKINETTNSEDLSTCYYTN